MDLSKISIGKNPPQEINVVIEITGGSSGGSPVKYEFDKESGGIFVDRIVNTSMFYPCNYADGDPTDVLVLLDIPLPPGVVIPCRPIGVLKMEDDGGLDDKIIAVPTNKIDPFQSEILGLDDLNEKIKERISHFFEHYKDLEKDKWVKLIGWGNKKEALNIVKESIENFNKLNLFRK